MEPELIQGGIAFILLNLAIQLIWSQRDRIGAIFQRRATVAANRKEAETELDRMAWQRLLSNGDWGKTLVNRLFMQGDQTLSLIVDMARNTENVATQSIAVMRDYGDLARALVDRLDAMDKTDQRINETLSGVGFVLARLYFRDDRQTFDDLVKEMDCLRE